MISRNGNRVFPALLDPTNVSRGFVRDASKTFRPRAPWQLRRDLAYHSVVPPPPRVDPLVGTVIDGRYRITERLGGGGMGSVYAAEHVHLDRRVAIKLMRPEFSLEPTAVARFRREALAGSTIENPHIAEVIDFAVSSDGRPYLVTEYIDGHDLDQDVRIGGPLELPRAVKIIGQVCEALAAAHKKGIIHRDLKPSNIMLTVHRAEADYVKVVDFGLAKVQADMSALTVAKAPIGTPAFMPPEQARGLPVDARADVYGIGGVLYFSLTGALPFSGATNSEVLLKVLNEPPLRVTQLRPDVPEGVADLVEALLAKQPEDRPSDVWAVKELLDISARTNGKSGVDAFAGTSIGLPPRALLDAARDPKRPKHISPEAWLQRGRDPHSFTTIRARIATAPASTTDGRRDPQ